MQACRTHWDCGSEHSLYSTRADWFPRLICKIKVQSQFLKYIFIYDLLSSSRVRIHISAFSWFYVFSDEKLLSNVQRQAVTGAETHGLTIEQRKLFSGRVPFLILTDAVWNFCLEHVMSSPNEYEKLTLQTVWVAICADLIGCCDDLIGYKMSPNSHVDYDRCTSRWHKCTDYRWHSRMHVWADKTQWAKTTRYRMQRMEDNQQTMSWDRGKRGGYRSLQFSADPDRQTHALSPQTHGRLLERRKNVQTRRSVF